MEHETAPSAAHEAAATPAASAAAVESHAAEAVSHPPYAGHRSGPLDPSALGFMFADVREDRVQFATMTREALTSMLRRTYESAIAPPDAPPDSAAMRAYNDRYLSWKKDPELQFNETLDRKGTR